ncbi:MAG TPA: hypothetical protein VGO53_16475 [Steroidobacteraceae bacterium]|nr:hypothetical protein [Steroidobacteraceae bacterium]
MGDGKESRVWAVEWHTIEGHRVSFDRRRDASRFLIMAPLSERHLRRFRPVHREALAYGLIEGNGYANGMGEPFVSLDQPAATVPFEVLVGMLDAWKRMVSRLGAGRE